MCGWNVKWNFPRNSKYENKKGNIGLGRSRFPACIPHQRYINYNSVFEIRSWPVRRERNYPRVLYMYIYYRIAGAPPVKSNLRPLQPLYKVLCRPHAAAIYTKTTTGDGAILITATTHRRGSVRSAWALINDWSRRRRGRRAGNEKYKKNENK